MAIEVRIPTILRTYTDGEKAVQGAGSTLDELITDLDSRHKGLRDRVRRLVHREAILRHTRARMKAKALVTGAGGLIGSACVQTLCEEGWDVIHIDNDGRCGRKNSLSRLEIIQALTDADYPLAVLDQLIIKDTKTIVLRGHVFHGPHDETH